MSLALFSQLGNGRAKDRTTTRGPGGGPARFRPYVEGLEDRVVPATSLKLPLDVGPVAVVGTEAAKQLVAAVEIGDETAGYLQITEMQTTAPAATGGVGIAQADECPILNLHLGPIDLNLLGLEVHTSEICLDVTAVDDQGLLGSLLCDLSSGLDLGGILNDLGGQLNNFLDRLEGLLDNVLGQALTVTGVLGTSTTGGVTTQQTGDVCDILNLSLGPIDLDIPLLGVSVNLDNCATPPGPVTIDVQGNPEGGILGDLLCGLAGGLDVGDLNLGGLVDRLDRLIDRLGDLADRLDDLENLTGDLNRIIDRLENLVDQVDSLRDLDKLISKLGKEINRLDKLIDRLT